MDKLTWEAPRITAHELQSLNKFGSRRARSEAQATIDGVAVETLAERYGSPLYVTSERRLRSNVRRIRQAFARYYPNVIQCAAAQMVRIPQGASLFEDIH